MHCVDYWKFQSTLPIQVQVNGGPYNTQKTKGCLWLKKVLIVSLPCAALANVAIDRMMNSNSYQMHWSFSMSQVDLPHSEFSPTGFFYKPCSWIGWLFWCVYIYKVKSDEQNREHGRTRSCSDDHGHQLTPAQEWEKGNYVVKYFVSWGSHLMPCHLKYTRYLPRSLFILNSWKYDSRCTRELETLSAEDEE